MNNIDIGFGTIAVEFHDGYVRTNDDLAGIHAPHQAAIVIRGKLLNEMINIESKVDQIIAHYFCGPDEGKRKLFLENLLRQRFFATIEKIKIFGEAQKQYVEEFSLDPAAAKKLRTNLRDLNEERNILAHNPIKIHIPEYIGKVHYLKGGKIKTKTIDENLTDGLTTKIVSIDSRLNELIQKIGFQQVG